MFNSNYDVPLDAYSDATWASEPDSKSTSGYLIRVFGNLVHYKSRKQTLVALSTTESEYIALSECCRDLLWIRNLLNEMGVLVEDASVVYCDNQEAIRISNGESKLNRTKHIAVK